MALSDTQIRAAKSADKPYKLTDGEGMHLLVHPNGSKYWRLSYRFNGKQKTLALGVYPATTLAAARTKRADAKQLLAEGVDPSEQKKNKSDLKSAMALPLRMLPERGTPTIEHGLNLTEIGCCKA